MLAMIRCSLFMLVPLIILHSIIENQHIPDYYKHPPELQASIKGYSIDRHFFATSDDYILQLFRLYKTKPNGPPVLFVHGLSVTGESFMLNNNT